MNVEFDPDKRLRVLAERDLDFLDAHLVFDSPHITIEDERFVYPEKRHITVGNLSGRMVVIVWTERDGKCRIISMRKANDREQEKYGARLG
jgi:uncharacterized protein